MKLLIDMNLSPAWARVLNQAGFESIHWAEVGAPNAPDKTLFDWAGQRGYVVFTHDMDFGAILAATRADSPSVFQIRTADVSPAALGPSAVELLKRFSPQLLEGALIVVDESRERVRILPLNVPS